MNEIQTQTEGYRSSESIVEIAKSLAEFHKEMGTIYKKDDNPFFKSKFASLPAILKEIKGPLETAGLVFSQFPVSENCLDTVLIHPESGEFFAAMFKMTPTKNDPQGQGSVITYQRRYALGAILGLNIDIDDDANAASEAPAKKATGKEAPTNDVDDLGL